MCSASAFAERSRELTERSKVVIILDRRWLCAAVAVTLTLLSARKTMSVAEAMDILRARDLASEVGRPAVARLYEKGFLVVLAERLS